MSGIALTTIDTNILVVPVYDSPAMVVYNSSALKDSGSSSKATLTADTKFSDISDVMFALPWMTRTGLCNLTAKKRYHL